MKVVLIVALMFFLQASPSCTERIFGKRAAVEKSSVEKSSFSPYKGKVNELLKPELSSGLFKFKLTGTTSDVNSYTGSTEAKGFTYMQEGAGISVKVDGALANYPTAAQAEAEIAAIAARSKGPLTKKNSGQRFVSNDGATIIWTNGSLLCVVTSGFAKPASNFEEAVPF